MANYKSAISFGLVHIPVTLKTVVRNNDTSFNQIHKKCLERILYIKYCPHCKMDVEQKDLIKGYEFSKNNYITFEKEDFEKLKSEDDKTLEIVSFVDYSEIDPIYFEKSYYLHSEDKNKAFSLFLEALKKSKKVAVVKTILGHKTYYGILRSDKNLLIFTTLYFEEEIMMLEKPEKGEFSDKELNLATKLIDSMSGSFEPEIYKDDYQDRIKDAIDKKVNGKSIKKVKGKKKENISNLIDALEQSLKESKK